MYKHNSGSFGQMWADVLGHEGDITGTDVIQSKRHGRWDARAWFEEDEPGRSTQPDSDWLTKVSAESSRGSLRNTGASQEGHNISEDNKSNFLVWEVERE